MREIDLRNKVVNVAKTFLGYSEANGKDDIIIRKYNTIKPKGSYTMAMTDAWCAAFASVVGNVAGLSSIIPIECSCQRMIEKFKTMGCWEEDGTTIPKIGDYIFYDWDNGVQPNDGWSDHVGIVTKVTGRTIQVIEGNKNNAVEYRTISVGWGYIRGYGKPDYSKLVTVDEQSSEYAIGEYVNFIGTSHYSTSYASGAQSTCKSGKAQITATNIGSAHPYHLIGIDGSTVYGWVNKEDINGNAKFDKNKTIKKGDKVAVTKKVTYTGKSFKVWHEAYDVIEVAGDRVVIGVGNTVTCAININNLIKV